MGQRKVRFLGAVLVLVGSVPAGAQTCDLSYDATPCTELPCPSAFVAKDCPEGQGPGLPGAPPWICHPYPQLRPPASKQCTTCDTDGCFTQVNTGEGPLVPSNPFDHETFPGTNLLPNVYVDAIDGLGNAMANTLPSTPTIPYNLHDGDPVISTIDPRSPTDDLDAIIDTVLRQNIVDVFAPLEQAVGGPPPAAPGLDRDAAALERMALRRALNMALDIIEGEPVPNRAYSGFPLLHYRGPEKAKLVQPIRDGNGDIVGGNVDVHQIWYGQHIESDTAFIDPSLLLGVTGPDGKPVTWTVTYTLDVLNRGHDDFSPFVTYTDHPDASPFHDTTTCSPPYPTAAACEAAHPSGNCVRKGPMPNVGMDQSFFDMEEGTRSVIRIKMAPAEYLNLVYTWGWRMHPPRIQVMEKAIKKIDYTCNQHETCPDEYQGCRLPQLEQHVFCNPDDPATTLISNGELFTPPYFDPSQDAVENTCSIVDLPNCGSVSCRPGQARFDGNGQPTQCEKNKMFAIDQIGDLSPAKRMWEGFHAALVALDAGDEEGARKIVHRRVTPAFFAWQNRTHLPCFEEDAAGSCVDGLVPDPDSDITILYVNNTIYGQLTAGGWVRWPDWETRFGEWQPEHAAWVEADAAWREAMRAWEHGPKTEPAPVAPQEPSGPPILDVTAYNSDHFPHSYTIADFGGSRGWENQFKSSVKVAGSGCWFTFGRAYWWMPAGAPNGFLCVDESGLDGPSVHKFQVQFNFEPSRRLRFYQFDPMHHDVAIYSIH